MVGPAVAVVSCVCSIGRAAGGGSVAGRISFGGVIAFLFADLIALPLLLVYRRYYGRRLMLRMLAVFWAVMSLAGLATGGLFRLAGRAPSGHRSPAPSPHLAWDYTTWLNIAALGLLAVVYRAARDRQPAPCHT